MCVGRRDTPGCVETDALGAQRRRVITLRAFISMCFAVSAASGVQAAAPETWEVRMRDPKGGFEPTGQSFKTLDAARKNAALLCTEAVGSVLIVARLSKATETVKCAPGGGWTVHVQDVKGGAWTNLGPPALQNTEFRATAAAQRQCVNRGGAPKYASKAAHSSGKQILYFCVNGKAQAVAR